MINTLKRNGWLNVVKVFGGLSVSAAVLIPAIPYVLAGA